MVGQSFLRPGGSRHVNLEHMMGFCDGWRLYGEMDAETIWTERDGGDDGKGKVL